MLRVVSQTVFFHKVDGRSILYLGNKRDVVHLIQNNPYKTDET